MADFNKWYNKKKVDNAYKEYDPELVKTIYNDEYVKRAEDIATFAEENNISDSTRGGNYRLSQLEKDLGYTKRGAYLKDLYGSLDSYFMARLNKETSDRNKDELKQQATAGTDGTGKVQSIPLQEDRQIKPDNGNYAYTANAGKVAAQNQRQQPEYDERGFRKNKNPEKTPDVPFEKEDDGQSFGARVVGNMVNGYHGTPNAFANYLGTKAAANLLGQGDNNMDSRHLRQQAELHSRLAGEEQKASQRETQQGNQNPFVTAGQIATAQAASENTQKVKNSADGAAASLERGVSTPDIQGQQQYTAQRREKGYEYKQDEYDDRQAAEKRRNMADAANMYNADMAAQNMNVNYAVSGGVQDGGQNTLGDRRSSDVVPEDTVSTQAEETPSRQETQFPGGTVQNVINANLNSNLRRTYNSNKQEKQWRVMSDGTVTPESKTANVQGAPEWTTQMEQQLQQLAQNKSADYNKQAGESDEAYSDRVQAKYRGGKVLGDEGFDEEASKSVPMNENVLAGVKGGI